MPNNIPLDWEFIKKSSFKISVLINNPLPEKNGSGKESYVGKVLSFNDDFLVLKTPNNSRIFSIAIKWEMILSVWLYNIE